jgi:hypothetical protein
MRFAALGLLTTLKLLIVGAIDIVPDSGGDCWSSTEEFFTKEIDLAATGFNLTEQRKYALCSNSRFEIRALNSTTLTAPTSLQ